MTTPRPPEPIHPDDIAACLAIAAALPDWFSNADGLRQMEASLRTDRGIVIRAADGTIAGCATLAQPFATTWEIAWMAVAPASHRQGIGRQMVETIVALAREAGAQMLVVKTLSASHPSPEYAATRAFYVQMGFLPVAEVPEHWGPENPCLIMARSLSATASTAIPVPLPHLP